MSIISDNLKKYRKDLSMSQAELADGADLTPAAICQFESGKKTPSIKTLRKIADTLKISVNDLMDGNEGKKDVTNNGVAIKFRGFNDMSRGDKNKVVEYFRLLQAQSKKKKEK